MRYFKLLSGEIVNWIHFCIKSLELSSYSNLKDKLNFSDILAINVLTKAYTPILLYQFQITLVKASLMYNFDNMFRWRHQILS
jgi:hypothetical protein